MSRSAKLHPRQMNRTQNYRYHEHGLATMDSFAQRQTADLMVFSVRCLGCVNVNDIDIDIAKCFVAFVILPSLFFLLYSSRFHTCLSSGALIIRLVCHGTAPASQLNAFIADNDFVVTSMEINQSVHADSAVEIEVRFAER